MGSCCCAQSPSARRHRPLFTLRLGCRCARAEGRDSAGSSGSAARIGRPSVSEPLVKSHSTSRRSTSGRHGDGAWRRRRAPPAVQPGGWLAGQNQRRMEKRAACSAVECRPVALRLCRRPPAACSRLPLCILPLPAAGFSVEQEQDGQVCEWVGGWTACADAASCECRLDARLSLRHRPDQSPPAAPCPALPSAEEPHCPQPDPQGPPQRHHQAAAPAVHQPQGVSAAQRSAAQRAGRAAAGSGRRRRRRFRGAEHRPFVSRSWHLAP